MYEIKKQIYLDFTKNQKSSLCSYLRAYVKQKLNLSAEEIFESFKTDEKYYLELNCSRFEFLAEIIDGEEFCSDSLNYINECKKYYEYKEKQRPIIEANKAYEKKKRESSCTWSSLPPARARLYVRHHLRSVRNVAHPCR